MTKAVSLNPDNSKKKKKRYKCFFVLHNGQIIIKNLFNKNLWAEKGCKYEDSDVLFLIL